MTQTNLEKPRREQLTIRALDGYPLGATYFLPSKTPHALVILNSATGVKRRYYDAFADELARLGFSALTFDYRGIGDSRQGSLRGFPAQMEDWARQDFAGVLRWSEQQAAPKRFAIGHSFGGQALAFTPGVEELDGLVLVAAQSGYWKYWSGFDRLKIFTFWHLLIPIISRLCGYLPGSLGIGEDLPQGVARQWARWGRHPEYAFGYLTDAHSLAARLKQPVFALSFSDDAYVPRRSAEALLAYLTSAEIEHRHLRPQDVGLKKIDHFGFFRQRHAEALWDNVLDWIKDHTKDVAERRQRSAAKA